MLELHQIVRKAEADYIEGNTQISRYVNHSMHETLETIDAYSNSKHLSGDKDSLGREKPFFNIVTAATNVWYRATDLDRRNIRVKATKEADSLGAFLATVHLQRWMDENYFGEFLNTWGRTLAKYGSAVVKFVEKGGNLVPSVVPWSTLIVDSVSFESNVKIEKLYFTPSELLMNKAYDQDVVKELIDQVQARETPTGEKKDSRAEYIEIYEVHGNLPLSLLTDNEKDDETFRQQMHVVSFLSSEGDSSKYDDFTLFSGKEKKDPYMITHLIEEDGRTLSKGAVEHLFDAQWMQNHSIKAMKDQLDLASKLVFQTSDAGYIGRNVLTAVENGDILIHAQNEPLTQINNGSHDIQSLTSFKDQWQILAQDITSTPDVKRGNTLPSGTAYRQAAILNEESSSLFEIMTENKGLAIERMAREFIIPHLLTKLDTTEEITATLESHDIEMIDKKFVPKQAVRNFNKNVIEEILQGNEVGQFNQEEEESKVQQDLATQGNQRFFKPSDIDSKTWKEYLKDLKWDLKVEVTNENTDKEATITTLVTVLQNLAQNPQLLEDPNARMLFGRILEETGRISPLQLASARSKPQPQPTAGEPAADVTPLSAVSNQK